MNKKAIAILGVIFLLILGTLGFLVYSRYFSQPGQQITTSSGDTSSGQPNPDQNSPQDTAAGQQPPAPSATSSSGQGAVKLVEDQVVSPVLFFNGNGVTYFNKQGQLFQAEMRENGGLWQVAERKSLDIEARPNLLSVLWPAAGNNFLARFESSGKQYWSFYDSASRSYSDLPSQVYSLDWLPSGEQIYYIWQENGKASMNIGDPNTANWQAIAEMWEMDDMIKVSPDGKNILYYQAQSSSSTNPIYLTTPDGKVWETPVKSGYNAGVQWSPDGQKFLFGRRESGGTKFQLWLYDLLAGQAKNLGVSTIPDKAVWSSDGVSVYAAVPVSGQVGEDNLTVDEFYRLNTVSGEKQRINSGSQAIDGRNLFLNSGETRLLFVNAQDGSLYYLDVRQ